MVDDGSDLIPDRGPRRKGLTKAETAAAFFGTIIICGTLIGVAFFISISQDHGCDEIPVLNLSGTLRLDEGERVLNLSLIHVGGDPIKLAEYAVTVNGERLQGPFSTGVIRPDLRLMVGESAYWLHQYAENEFTVGTQYVVKVIVIEDLTIVWQKSITAIEAL